MAPDLPNSPSVDEAFASFVRTGRPGDLAKVFDEAAPELLRLASHLVTDLSHAEDLVQSTFLVAIERCRDYTPSRPVIHWLTGILTNRARQLRREMGRKPDPGRLSTNIARDPSEEIVAMEFTVAISDAIADVPEPYRPVVLMHLKLGQPVQEIALVLGRAPGTVRKQLARGIAMLRKTLPPGVALGGAAMIFSSRGLAAIREVVLARAAVVPATTLSLVEGILIMKTKLTLAGIGLAVAFFATWLFTVGPLSSSSDSDKELSTQVSEKETQGNAPTSDTVEHKYPKPDADLERVELSRGFESPKEATGSLGVTAWLVNESNRVVAKGLELVVMSGRRSSTIMAERNVKTDSEGRIHVSGLPIGDVMVVPARGLHGNAKATIVPGGDTHVHLFIKNSIRIGGVVVDRDGVPVDDAIIEFHSFQESKPLEQIGRSAPDGTFEVMSGATGNVSARKTGYHALRSQMIPSSRSARANIRIVLRNDGGAVRGVVVNELGVPVPGARVRIGTQEHFGRYTISADGVEWYALAPVQATTDSNGEFRVVGLKPGELPIFVKGQNMAPWSGTFLSPTQGEASVRIELEPGASCGGVALVAEGNPALGARIYVESGPSWHLRFSTRVAVDGSFSLTGLPIGPLKVLAYNGGEKQVQEIVGEPGKRTRVDIFFGPELQLTGRVVLNSGQGVAGVALVAFSGKGWESWRTTKADGRFSFDKVPPGQLLTVKVVGGIPSRVMKERVDPGAGELVITVPDPGSKTGRVAGRIVDADGRPLANATVTLFLNGAQVASVRVANPTGTFVFEKLYGGKYALYVDAPDHERHSDSRELAAGATWDTGILWMKRRPAIK